MIFIVPPYDGTIVHLLTVNIPESLIVSQRGDSIIERQMLTLNHSSEECSQSGLVAVASDCFQFD